MTQRFDSNGNPIPTPISFDNEDLPGDKLSEALSINMFNMAVDVSLQNGDSVEYDSTEKAAVITTPVGEISVIRHH